MEDSDVSLRGLARNLGVSSSALSKVAAGKTTITPEMALRLEAGVGISARLWMAILATYDLSLIREAVDLSQIMPPKSKRLLTVH
ncbi:HigA family addiction module antitoxin [Scandinavium goeteborgense]|uniref:HigA family addiction module antitoxin n=1 Tax=Scandinavium goeteborgense TaxID=1851514 RepID=UPI0038104310